MSEKLPLPDPNMRIPDKTVLEIGLPFSPEGFKNADAMTQAEVGDIAITGVYESGLRPAEILATPKGLDVQIEDVEVAANVAEQLRGFRSFLTGEPDAGESVDGKEKPKTFKDAFDSLTDLATLHVLDTDLEAVELSLLRAGASMEEAKEQRTVLDAQLKQRSSDILAQSIRSTDIFLHNVSSGESVLGVIRSGALKSKPKMMQEGFYKSATGGARGKGITIEGLQSAMNARYDDTSGLHSLLIHTRQRETVDVVNSSALDVYFPAHTLIDVAPYVTRGQDAMNRTGGFKNRIQGHDEAHGGGVRNRYSPVKISATEEYLSTLPEARTRELVDDVTFLKNTNNPATAGTYEFPIEEGVVKIGEQGLLQFAQELAQREDIPQLTQKIRDRYLGDRSKVGLLKLHLDDTRKEIASGDKFEEMEYATVEGKNFFRILVGHADAVEAELRAILPDANMEYEYFKDFINETAILRTLMPYMGRSEEWSAKNVYSDFNMLKGGPVADTIGDMIARRIQPASSVNEFYIQSEASELAFKQQDMARAAVESYVQALAA